MGIFDQLRKLSNSSSRLRPTAAPTGPTWPPPLLPRHPWLTLVVGRRGSGKSYLATQLLKTWPVELGARYVVDPVSPDPPTPDYPAFWGDLWNNTPPAELPAGTGLMVVDEADGFLPSAQGKRDSLLQHLVLRGRHHGCSLMLCTQRPSLVGTDVRSQAGRIYVFRMTAEDDIKAILKVAPELRGREDEIERLPVGRALVWDSEFGAWPEK